LIPVKFLTVSVSALQEAGVAPALLSQIPVVCVISLFEASEIFLAASSDCVDAAASIAARSISSYLRFVETV